VIAEAVRAPVRARGAAESGDTRESGLEGEHGRRPATPPGEREDLLAKRMRTKAEKAAAVLKAPASLAAAGGGAAAQAAMPSGMAHVAAGPACVGSSISVTPAPTDVPVDAARAPAGPERLAVGVGGAQADRGAQPAGASWEPRAAGVTVDGSAQQAQQQQPPQQPQQPQDEDGATADPFAHTFASLAKPAVQRPPKSLARDGGLRFAVAPTMASAAPAPASAATLGSSLPHWGAEAGPRKLRGAYMLFASESGGVFIWDFVSGQRYEALTDIPELQPHARRRGLAEQVQSTAAAPPSSPPIAERSAASAPLITAPRPSSLIDSVASSQLDAVVDTLKQQKQHASALAAMRARELASASIRSISLSTRPRALEEVLTAARAFGIEPFEEPELLWLLDLALCVEIPAGWIESEISMQALEQRASAGRAAAEQQRAVTERPGGATLQPHPPANTPRSMVRRESSRLSALHQRRRSSRAEKAPPMAPSVLATPPLRAPQPARLLTYYHNTLTGRSQWVHPIDAYVRHEIKRWRYPNAEQSAHKGDLRMRQYYELISF
jgi:hypothetical protein